MRRAGKRLAAFVLTMALVIGLMNVFMGETNAALPKGINYRTYVQKEAWQSWVSNGAFSGTKGKSYRLETIQIKLTGIKGGVSYCTYVQKLGWQGWAQNGEKSGTTGKGYRLEAIRIKLTGDAAKNYDVYYRVYAQSYGWLGWAKNGGSAGTSGLGLRLEGIQIKLVAKGGKAPGASDNAYVRMTKVAASSVPDYNDAKFLLGRFQNTTHGFGPLFDGVNLTYDCNNPDTTYFGVMYQVLGTPSMLGLDDKSVFPVEVEYNRSKDDPRGWFMDTGYWMIDAEDYEWLCRNVLNMSDANVSKMLDAYNSYDTYYGSYRYYYSYIVSSTNRAEGVAHCPIEVERIRTDGRYYYFDYELYGTDVDTPLDIKYTAKMKLKDYKGEKYWSVYSVKRR